MKNSLVSIVIPLYDSAEYILKCVGSCLNQTYENIEIIVVDDGSTDDGLDVVKKVASEDKRVKVFHKENGGVSSARNMGVRKANGEYICFIDADDYLENNFVEVMLGYMENGSVDFCLSKNIWNINNNNNNVGGNLISSSEAESALLGPKIHVGCWNKMYKKTLLNNIRFDENLFYGEGLKFIIEIAHNAKRIMLCEDALYHYRRVNPNSATTKFDLSKMINGEKSLLEINEIIKYDGKSVRKAWKKHYCLFCINAMLGALKIGKKNEYKIWKKKFIKAINIGAFADSDVKTNVRMLLALISPKLLALIVYIHEKGRG